MKLCATNLDGHVKGDETYHARFSNEFIRCLQFLENKKRLSKDEANFLFSIKPRCEKALGKIQHFSFTHRDLSPEHMILSEDGQIYPIDFAESGFDHYAWDLSWIIYFLIRKRGLNEGCFLDAYFRARRTATREEYQAINHNFRACFSLKRMRKLETWRTELSFSKIQTECLVLMEGMKKEVLALLS